MIIAIALNHVYSMDREAGMVIISYSPTVPLEADLETYIVAMTGCRRNDQIPGLYAVGYLCSKLKPMLSSMKARRMER